MTLSSTKEQPELQGSPEHFIARQPIFDQNLTIFAYELLFRAGLQNFFGHTDSGQATTQLIVNSMLLFGMEAMTGPAKAFINFPRELLLNGSARLLPKDKAVVEILEDVEPDREILTACAQLQKDGFALALDDYVGEEKFDPLLGMVDIIKVDFLGMSDQERLRLAQYLAPRRLQLLAEKVETHQDFEAARQMGYTLFQGYFFCEPVIVRRKDISSNKVQLLQLLRELNRPDLQIKELAGLISSDVGMSFKLLRYINSAAFSLLAEVTSIEQALNLLGELEIRKWATLITMAGISEGKPTELMATSVVRAKLAEALAKWSGVEAQAQDYFIMGLFSLLDTIFGRPLAEVLEELPLSAEIKDALLGKNNQGRRVLDLIIGLEQGGWPQVDHLAAEMKLDEKSLASMHMGAVLSSRELMGLAA